MKSILSIFCLLCVVQHLQCARILAIVQTPCYSHQVSYRPLWLELNKRGHDVVLVTTNPIPNLNLPNFTQIDIGANGYKSIRKFDFIRGRFEGSSWLSFAHENFFDMAHVIAKVVLDNPELQKIYATSSNRTFDVVMMEMLMTPALYTLAHRFNAPLIGLSSLGLFSLTEHVLGGFVLPSHEYTWEMAPYTGPDLSFWRRLTNYVQMWHHVYLLHSEIFPRQQQIAEEYFGLSIPHVLDIMKNTSLIFVDQSDAWTPPKPKLANMITYTSFHVHSKPSPLPKDLKNFLDDATEGFIYFSLGSHVMSSDLPKEVQQIFLDVFAKLPYRVVWKFEKELKNKNKNVYTSPWLPQQSVLAHPNIKLFMYQGGLQSSEEATHYTVPVIGFPVIGDQDYQVGRMTAVGVGKNLDLTTVTREQLEDTIREVITNKQYKENMIKLKKLMNDNPYDLMDNLVWWTEYVIRHNGAPHLRSSIIRQPWYQRGDMDILVFLTVITCIVGFIVLVTLAKFFIVIMKRGQVHEHNQKKHKIS